MKGRHRVLIQNKKIQFDFEVVRNITVIRGDSATGKTTLIDMLSQYEQDKTHSGISLSCDKACTVLTGLRWEENLSMIHDSIVFIDENDRFITSNDFARAIQNSDNYYVIITRDNLSNLPYSVEEIYGIHTSGKYMDMKKTYNEFYRIYGDISESDLKDAKPNQVIVEDSNSGYDFIKEVLTGSEIKGISAEGKSKIYSILLNSKEEYSLVVGDGAAFGNEMNRIMELKDIGYRFLLYLPESFEWLILKSGLIDGNRIKEIIETPEEYIESGENISWERFFTKLLISETENTYQAYSKDKLNDYYLQEKQRNAIISSMDVVSGIIK